MVIPRKTLTKTVFCVIITLTFFRVFTPRSEKCLFQKEKHQRQEVERGEPTGSKRFLI